jgi:hypothetical protein
MTPRRRRGCLIAIVLIALAAVAVRWWYRQPEPLRISDYALDLRLPKAAAAAPSASLRVGAAAVDITPDPAAAKEVWMAGFSHGRRALSKHDPLSARAIVLDDGRSRIAIVGLDLIGMHHDETVRIRRALPKSLALDYLAVCCLHNHNSPDTLGLWGANPLRSGVDPEYMARVRDATIDALRQAVQALGPARMVAAEVDTLEDGLIRDSRPPKVIDARLLALRFEDPAAKAGAPARATLVVWSNHPESLGSENQALTSDFPHYVRRGIERDGGGTCVYLSGSVGGLMTPLEQAVRGLDGKTYDKDGFEKAEAIGEVLARRAREALAAREALRPEAITLAARARLLDAPATNWRFWAAMKMGVLDRGMKEGEAGGPPRVQTEVGALRLGPVTLILCPGEIYPEIVVGGVERPEGGDYPGEVREVPPLREVAAAATGGGAGALVALVGLANDEVGYIVPRTQWDELAPYTYGQSEAPYGEMNSLGPDAAPILYRALADVVAELAR